MKRVEYYVVLESKEGTRYDTALQVAEGTARLWVCAGLVPPPKLQKVVLDIISEMLDNKAQEVKRLQEVVKNIRYAR